MNTKMLKQTNIKYRFLQGSFWMLYCTGGGFVSLFLLEKGLSNATIGTITAIFGLLAALLSPMIGRLCDRNPRFTWKRMIQGLAIPFPFVCLGMLLSSNAMICGILIGCLLLIGNMILPFIGHANFYYQRQGISLNFGVARGIGSASYAICSLVIGNLAGRYGVMIVPIAGILVALLLLVVTLPMECHEENMAELAEAQVEEPGTVERFGIVSVLKKYQAFSVMLLATLFMLTSHCIAGTYLLQIIQSLGGNSSQLGTSLAIQALAEIPVLFGFSLLIKRFSPKTLMCFAAAGFALKALLFFLAGNIFMLYLSLPSQMVGFAIFTSASVYYAAQSVERRDQVTAQTLMTSMIVCGNVLGNLIGGWILELFGVHFLLACNVGISLCGVLLSIISVKIMKSTIPHA